MGVYDAVIDDMDGVPAKLKLNIRPHLRECLLKLKSKFEIIVFTAAEQPYAEAILNHLDPNNELFDHRIYRKSCS